MPKLYEITGIGNAIVDVIAHGTDAFLQEHNITKGGMSLIDEAYCKTLYANLTNPTQTSGGSAANTIAGFASFGGKSAFIGKVADDALGAVFAQDIRGLSVHFNTPALQGGASTARCMIIVTPDAQRSMSTFLGASIEFAENDVDETLIANSDIIYLEGYLFDKDVAKQAYKKASHAAKKAGTKVALTLSDSFCVARHRDDFKNLIASEVDIVFANEAEILSLYETDNFDDAVNAIRGKCDIAAITRSEKGSVIVTADETLEIQAQPVAKVVDTTGAGDQYAAGFLFGYVRGMDLKTCGALGSLAAAEVISHLGPRPEISLATLAQQQLGIKLAA
jgi:sugar/nucleoside kinase (ribokinase family)